MTSRAAALDDPGAPESDALNGYPHPRKQRVLFGHQAEAAGLAQAARNGRLHHGLLLTGPKGVGKATLAWRLARALLSHGAAQVPDDLATPPNGRAGMLIDALAHPDVLLLRRPWDEKNKRHKTVVTVDEIRKANAFFGSHASQGGWRVAIVDAADDMNTEAENALLKTLEEPPPRALLILIANAAGALLPTTRSRCRKVALKPLGHETMAHAIAALDPAGAQTARETLIALAEGSPGRALALGQGEALSLYADLVRLLGTAGRPDIGIVSSVADRLSRQGAGDSFKLFAELFGQILRWMVLAKAGRPESLRLLGRDGDILLQACQRSRLERWAGLWDTVQASFARAEALNLDKRHTLIDAFLEAEASLR